MKQTHVTSQSQPAESPWEILKRLYDREISAGIVSDVDGGVTVWIEHPNLTQAIFTREELDKVAEWMLFEERRLFPPT
jgi:hypothetical protein